MYAKTFQNSLIHKRVVSMFVSSSNRVDHPMQGFSCSIGLRAPGHYKHLSPKQIWNMNLLEFAMQIRKLVD